MPWERVAVLVGPGLSYLRAEGIACVRGVLLRVYGVLYLFLDVSYFGRLGV